MITASTERSTFLQRLLVLAVPFVTVYLIAALVVLAILYWDAPHWWAPR